MFTGIIEATARVLEATSSSLVLGRPKGFTDLKRGSSVAVSGVCITVVKLTKESMNFDVVLETLKRTKLGSLKVGDRVNLERALKIGDRFEGHIVQGHVDGVGNVKSVTLSGVPADASSSLTDVRSAQHDMAGAQTKDLTLTISYPPNLKNLLVEKGSIAIDGVSLTIASVDTKTFSVALIPHTLEETTLGELKEGDKVNLEGDVVGKYLRSNY